MPAQPSLLSAMTAAALTAAGSYSVVSVDVGQAGHGQDRMGRQQALQDPWEGVTRAVAVIRSTEGNDVRGTVRFERADGGVRVTAVVHGLRPGSKHGFHVHEFGDATGADGASAGSHYDPAGTDHHARPGADGHHHAGDMGNLEADEEGVARFDKTFGFMSIAGSEAPIIGRAVVVHAEPDEFDQPTGSAGDRIGIGVIGVANPEEFGEPLER